MLEMSIARVIRQLDLVDVPSFAAGCLKSQINVYILLRREKNSSKTNEIKPIRETMNNWLANKQYVKLRGSLKRARIKHWKIYVQTIRKRTSKKLLNFLLALRGSFAKPFIDATVYVHIICILYRRVT